MIDVDTPYRSYRGALGRAGALERTEIERFERDGFIRLEGVFSASELAHFEPAVSSEARSRAWNRNIPMEKRGIYERAFLQAGNLWRTNEVVRTLSFSRRLARIATELLGTRGVRMYHDQALYKEPGYGITPWHVDQQYWPLASDRALTAWVPLQAVPLEMGPMSFARGSQRMEIGRALPISEESEAVIRAAIEERGIDDVLEPFALGDVSFHRSWTLHHAGPNRTERARCVHTVIYIDSEMRLAEPTNPNQKFDWKQWSPSTRIGEIMADDLNPILYER